MMKLLTIAHRALSDVIPRQTCNHVLESFMSALKSVALAASLNVVCFAPASAATVYIDVSAFAAATTNISTEAFDTPISGRTIFDAIKTITFAGGTTSTAISKTTR